jgi:nitrile hydratase subunit beta
VNGAADLGGMMGFGPVEPEPEGHPFHADWERRALALTLALGAAGRWSIDASRHARESLPPPEYLTSSYYEIWIKALERLLVTSGLVAPEELARGAADRPGEPVRVLRADEVPGVLAAGTPYERPLEAAPRFAVGERVRTRNIHPTGHTRLPRYARAKVGVVERVHGAYVLPDTNAHGAGEHPQWVYAVRFTGRELWGEDADPGHTVLIDAWECYVEPADQGSRSGETRGAGDSMPAA